MEDEEALAAFSALAQPTRLAILKLLVRSGGAGVPAGEIAHAVEAPASTISTHLAILERAGLIASRRESRSIIYSSNMDTISDVLAYLIDDCCNGRPEICAPLTAVVNRATACCPKPAAKKRKSAS